MNFRKPNLQEILSISYLILIVLGILLDVIFYKILGINILDYASITDVLLSPIKLILHDVIFTIFIIVFMLLIYYSFKKMPQWSIKYANHKYLKDIFYVKSDDGITEDKKQLNFVFYMVISLASLLIGFRYGSANSLKKKLENHSLKSKHKIEFKDSIIKDVRIIGVNTGYIFYVIDSTDKICISPLSSEINKIISN